VRPEATGYGLVYFAAAMLARRDETLEGRRCVISGSGNVAQYTCEKLLDLGAKPLTFSDSDGFIYDPDGITREKLEWVKKLKNERRGRIREYAEEFEGARYTQAGGSMQANPIWEVPADCAFPCATENEIRAEDARTLLDNGLKLIAEGSNMPCTPEAGGLFEEAEILLGPSKATNAGGVAVSAMEMSQNSSRVWWSREQVDRMLQDIMQSIHDQASEAAEEYGMPGNYVAGANIAGFLKVAKAMMDQGVV
jgi:glutamate dehydrogenase (NADP+)